ncbi:uncharacterized protein LOC131242397 [Magnolia sinica]|uniref:uncharacterized protein LOC131242397 n=1 Tax=Magnolia sinica TaxID=86752 RepID=UPI00265891C5|nr:uncharacterized protein LOC131242397 [Magnolia sinica]
MNNNNESNPIEIEKKPNILSKQRTINYCFCSPKIFVSLIITFVTILILFQIQSVETPFSLPSAHSPSWASLHSWGEKIFNTHLSFNCTAHLDAIISRLRDSVTFLPLKDLRFATTAMQDHTWFMSSLNDTYDGGESEYQYFPSEASKGRLLCLMGRDRLDGGRNSYALAWPDSLPRGATVLGGLTYVSDTYYDYDNLWHGLMAMMPFVEWYKRKGCVVPTRWILYHWGEVRVKMGTWVGTLMGATFGGVVNVEGFEGGDGGPTCLEKAVVFRHNMGRMVEEKRMEVFDMMRCRARAYCNVSGGAQDKERGGVRLTVLLRTGARAFKNESGVVGIFERECGKVEGCRLTVARSDNMTFCDQVKMMSSTDILASSHGAQLTNMFLMDTNSSVMEFFPRGWLELAGVGQYVYHWEASWSGMKHQGAWRDAQGDECPNPEPPGGCMSFYKASKIGHNETHLVEWARNVLKEVKIKRLEEASRDPVSPPCPCS